MLVDSIKIMANIVHIATAIVTKNVIASVNASVRVIVSADARVIANAIAPVNAVLVCSIV